jgi:hypothetical protein
MRPILFTAVMLFSYALTAQVPKKSIVEHFTNSSCSICANNNPLVYSALQANPNVLHITFYPSSPYSNCFFHVQNPVDNDARTNFYGVYGATPKIVVNGALLNLANLPGTLQNAATDSSNFEMLSTQQFITSDSVKVTVTIKRKALDTIQNALLFVGAMQDTVMQLTNNGESIHEDVFRKSLTAVVGNLISLPTSVNDSVVFTYGYAIPTNWNAAQMKTLSILQQTVSKEVLQSEISTTLPLVPLSVSAHGTTNISVYPNPVRDRLHISNDFEQAKVILWTMDGRKVMESELTTPDIAVEQIPDGMYTLQWIQKGIVQYQKIIIQKN